MLIGLVQEILETIATFFVGILLFIDALVYSLINWVYQIIMTLCNVDILNNSDEVTAFVGRVYIIIGVVVLFLVAYSLLKSMINPDEAFKGKKSPIKIIGDVVISVVLIALIPMIFSYARAFQTSLLEANTLGKIILGDTSSTGDSSKDTISQGGMTMATGVLEAFLHENYDDCEYKGAITEEYPRGYDCSSVTIDSAALDGQTDKSFRNFWEIIKNRNLFYITDLASNVVNKDLTYYFIISTVAGAFTLFVLISYCFDIAIRTIKLAVYELMAPLPILSRILPNEQGNKIFSNWIKATLSTFAEVFIRLAILYFSVLLIKIVLNNVNVLGAFISSSGENGGIVIGLFAQMFIIVGIIMFIKQAPALLKEITGLDGGKYNVLGSAMLSLGAMGALTTGAVRAFNQTPESDKNYKTGFNRVKNAILGGGKSAYNAANKEYKGVKDIKSNTRSSVEDVINRQRQRQADKETRKREKAAYNEQTFERQEGESELHYRARSNKLAGYRFNKMEQGVREWAGASGSDPTADARTKEAINAIGSLVGTMQDLWKKDPGYIKAKEEASNASAARQAMEDFYAKTKMAAIAAGANETAATKQAEDAFRNRYNTDYATGLAQAQEKEAIAKDLVDSQAKAIQRSGKAAAIAGKVLELQQTQAKFGEIDFLNIDNLKDISPEVKASIKKYQNLADRNVYNQFVADLKNGEQSALDYLDALDKLDSNAKIELSAISGREIERSRYAKKEDKK